MKDGPGDDGFGSTALVGNAWVSQMAAARQRAQDLEAELDLVCARNTALVAALSVEKNRADGLVRELAVARRQIEKLSGSLESQGGAHPGAPKWDG
jgi:hypothetical protein